MFSSLMRAFILSYFDFTLYCIILMYCLHLTLSVHCIVVCLVTNKRIHVYKLLVILTHMLLFSLSGDDKANTANGCSYNRVLKNSF